MNERFAFAAADREDYVDAGDFHDSSSGDSARSYEISSGGTLDRATPIDPSDWIRLRAAVDLVARSEILRNSGDILVTLVAALKSASILAIHGTITRTDVTEPDGGHAVSYEKFYLAVYPHQWATSISINIHDNSINLADGRPLLDIFINKQDVEDWIEARSSATQDFSADADLEQRRFERTYRLVNVGADAFVFPKSQGGRPQKYDWADAYLKLCIRHLFVSNELSDRTTQTQIIAMLRGVFTSAYGLDDGPQDSILKKHARRIYNELQKTNDA
jgi:hypothetical protein